MYSVYFLYIYPRVLIIFLGYEGRVLFERFKSYKYTFANAFACPLMFQIHSVVADSNHSPLGQPFAS